jgi:prepilin-type N-terminal cleavage/methylation domain-containing protein
MPVDAGQHKRTAGARAGFTLLELVVVMVMLGIITGLAVPIFSGSLTSIQLKNARSDFLATLYHTQERAVAESREFRLYLDDKKHVYWVMVHTRTTLDEKEFEEVEEDFGRARPLPPYLEFDRVQARKDRMENAHYIACYPTGMSDRAEVAIRDIRARNRRFEIAVEGPLGRVEVKQ